MSNTYKGPGDIPKTTSAEGKAELAKFLQDLNGLTPEEAHSRVVSRSMSPGAGLAEVTRTFEGLVYDVSQQLRVVLGRPPRREDIPLIGEAYLSKLNSLVDPELMAGIERVRLKVKNVQQEEALPDEVERISSEKVEREYDFQKDLALRDSKKISVKGLVLEMIQNNPGIISPEQAKQVLTELHTKIVNESIVKQADQQLTETLRFAKQAKDPSATRLIETLLTQLADLDKEAETILPPPDTLDELALLGADIYLDVTHRGTPAIIVQGATAEKKVFEYIYAVDDKEGLYTIDRTNL